MALLSIYSAGLLATALAVLQLAGWLAIGRVWVRDADEFMIPVAMLLGHGICAALAAGLAAAGLIGPAIVLPAALALGALAWRRRDVWGATQRLGASLRDLAGERWLPLILLVAFVYWLIALAPPRDADVLRYHLAHIRQILQDGAWLPIADYHYALPFGWSLTYLPFEALGLPQVAHMLNLGLLTIAAAALFRLLGRYTAPPIARLLALAFVGHTAVLHMGTTARADMYVVFVVLAATALVLRLGDGTGVSPRQAALLGVVAWIGAQSRYQAVALGMAVSAVLLVYALRHRLGARALGAYAGGAAVALMLAAPFYLFNWVTLGNPVWPLMIGTFAQTPTYADAVAQAYSSSLNGTLGPATLLRGIWRLVTSPVVFPVPLAAILLIVAALRWRSAPAPALALFTVAFLALWALAQPRLYPRFSMMLLVPVLVGWSPLLERWSQADWGKALLRAGLAVLLALYAALNLAYAYDYLAYALTADRTRFHAFTWFKSTYDWFNAAVTDDARPLVVVTSAQSYYLDRAHRRADPRLSGVIDWSAVGDAADLRRLMAEGGYTHLIYELADWSRMPGGPEMMAAVRAAGADGTLHELGRFEERLSTSRLFRDGYATTVVVYEVSP